MKLTAQYPQLKAIQDLAKRRKRKVYLVGGFLRDYVLKRTKADFDFAVDEKALSLTRAFATRIKGAFVLLDEERGSARVVKKVKGEIYMFDFSDFRAKTLKGDLSRRDFTINTLAVNITDLDQSVDLLLKGQLKALRDIKAKKIRMVSSKAFKDDPLRMLRAFALKATLGFTIEKKTIDQIKKEKRALLNVSTERVRDELFKILESNHAAKVLKEMDRVGLLEFVIPQVKVMYGCKQGGYHHLDVWPHSLETVAQTEKVIKEMQSDSDIDVYLKESIAGVRTRTGVMKLAALLHDIGKPDTRKREKGKVSFHGHEKVGRDIVRPVARMLKLSTKERHMIEDMVLWHLRPGYLSNFKNPSDRMRYRFLRDTKDEAAAILLLSLADQRSTCGPLTTKADQKHHEKICKEMIGRYFDKLKEKPFVRLIDGKDIIKRLKIEPSPLIGKILLEVEEKQTLGKIKTKREAFELAEKIVS